MSSRTYIAREEIIQAVGLNAAVIYERLKFIIEQNTREERHFHDGKYWTSNTYEGWMKYFPFFTVKQLRTAFSKLIQADLIETGNYNKQNTDRTIWYALISETQDVDSPDLPLRADGNALKGSSAYALKGSSAYAQKGRSYKELENNYKSFRVEATPSHKNFLEFYALCPRAGGTEETEKAYDEALVSGKTHQELMYALRCYREHNADNLKNRTLQYVKFSHLWLSDRYYDRYPIPDTKPVDLICGINPLTVQAIRDGKAYACRQVSSHAAAALVAGNHVTAEQCRGAGVAL